MTPARQPTQSLEILVAPHDSGGVLIAVDGDLDAFSVDYLAVQISDLLAGAAADHVVPDGELGRRNQPSPTGIALNLAGVEFIDAAAVGRLGHLHRLAAEAGCVLSISAATQFTWWLLSSAGLASIFPIPGKHRWASEPGS
jgi:hypothetical protein